MYLFVFSARIDKCGDTSAQKFFKFSVWSEPHHIVKCWNCSIQTRHSLFRPQGTSSKAGVSILAGNGKEGTGKGRAKFASFMQPSGRCSELDCNLMLCDSQLEEGSIITGLQGAAEFLSAVGKMYRSLVSTRNTVLWYLCPLTSLRTPTYFRLSLVSAENYFRRNQ